MMYIIIFLLILLFIGAVGFSVVYYFTAGKDEDSTWRHKEYKIWQKLLLILNVAVTILSIYSTIYGFVDPEQSTFAAVGVVLWLVTSVVSAYVCSPLRLSAIPTIQANLGWSQVAFYPLLAIMLPVSIVLTMLISWVFALIAIFKHTKIWFKLIAALLILSVALTPPAIVLYNEYKEFKHNEVQSNIREGIINKIATAIDSGSEEKIILTDEEAAYCDENNIYNPFSMEEVQGLVAEKFCKINNEKDKEGFIKFIEYLMINRVHFGSNGAYFDSLAFFRDTIIEKSEKQYFDKKLNRDCYDFSKFKVSINDEMIVFMDLPNESGMSDTFIIMQPYYDNRYTADGTDLIIGETVMTVTEYKGFNR